MTSWDTWVQLAGALRRRGVRVVRITGRGGSTAQRLRTGLERTVFDRTRAVLDQDAAGRPAIAGLLPLLAESMDVQMVDAIGVELTSSQPWSGHEHLQRSTKLPDASLYDKFSYSRVAAVAGVPVSRCSPLPTSGTDLQGAPRVLKARIGSGGQYVRFVHSDEEVARTLQEWRRDPAEVFLQDAVHGRPWTVGGVADSGEVLVGATYETRSAHADPYGPAVFVRLQPNPGVLGMAQRVVAALGYTGPFAMDFIDDGTPYLIDFNPRFFGSWPILQAGGVDLVGAYLATLGHSWQGPRAAARTPWLRSSARGQPGIAGSWRRARDLTSRLRPVIGRGAARVIGVESVVDSFRHPDRTQSPPEQP